MKNLKDLLRQAVPQNGVAAFISEAIQVYVRVTPTLEFCSVVRVCNELGTFGERGIHVHTCTYIRSYVHQDVNLTRYRPNQLS